MRMIVEGHQNNPRVNGFNTSIDSPVEYARTLTCLRYIWDVSQMNDERFEDCRWLSSEVLAKCQDFYLPWPGSLCRSLTLLILVFEMDQCCVHLPWKGVCFLCSGSWDLLQRHFFAILSLPLSLIISEIYRWSGQSPDKFIVSLTSAEFIYETR